MGAVGSAAEGAAARPGQATGRLPASAVAALEALLPALRDAWGADAVWWQGMGFTEGETGAVIAVLGLPDTAPPSLDHAPWLLRLQPADPGAPPTSLGREPWSEPLGLRATGAQQPGGPLLALAAQVAQALIDTHARAEAWRQEAVRRGDAGRVASDWLWETDAEGQIVWISEPLHPLTGEPTRAELGRLVSQVYTPRSDEHRESWARYQQKRAAREPFRDLLVDRDVPRGRLTVSISGNPHFDEAGRFRGYRGANREVTEELAIRREANRSRELLEQTLAGLPARVMISDAEGRVLLANAAWRANMDAALPAGCNTWAETVAHHVAQGHYPDALGREQAFLAWRLGLVGEAPVAQELRWCDGWALVVDRRLADGSVVHLSIDITERKRAEQALVDAELRWRFALEGAGDGVWDWDAATDRTYFSERSAQMLGLTQAQLGADWRSRLSLMHPDDRPQVIAELHAHVEGRSELYEAVNRVRHADGHYVWVRDRGKAVLRDASGRALRIVGTHSDISHEREAEAAAREHRAIELASRSKSEFLSRVSHEMRTPLNALLGFARLLQQQGRYRDDYLQHMLVAGMHLQDLINDVLDVQQIEQGLMVLQRQPVDLAALVGEVVAMLQPLAQSRQVHLGPPPAGPAWVLADLQRLRQVLLNLGSNAIKYNRPGGGVRWLQAEAVQGRLAGHELQLHDDGIGMSALQLARLFQPFERLGRERTGIEGTGLGLVIARRLVEAQGGRIAVQSQPAQGTKVQLWLPAAPAPGPGAGAAQAVAPAGVPVAVAAPAGTAPRRVLLVEDDPLSALLFGEALRAHTGLVLRVAGNGETALALAAQWQPELLVIDGHLPDAKGHELLAQLRRLPGLDAVPAVIATADAMPADREAALARGFIAHWPKPLDVRHLPAQIVALLAG